MTRRDVVFAWAFALAFTLYVLAVTAASLAVLGNGAVGTVTAFVVGLAPFVAWTFWTVR